MKNSQDNQYFPFWFYQDITPSLEHIHPQHLHDEDIDFDIRCQWYADKRKELQGMDEAKNKEIKDACALLDKVLLLTEEEKKKEDKAFIKSYNDKKKKYEEDVTTCRSNLEKIDQLFDELATIDEYELHSIKNMALVDKNTNSVLGNGLMATKRQKLMDLQAKFNETNGEEGAYTFMGTWKIFNKQFINVNAEEKSNVKTSDLLFWSKKDRENYFADIETIYKEYVK